jgi:FkbM family methyltransferase
MEKVKIESIAGDALVCVEDRDEHLQRHWLRRKSFYEHDLLDHIWSSPHIEGGVMIDVGSCIGNHTLYFAKFCKPDFVISIEPNKNAFDLQERILALNGVANRVHMLNKAAGVEESRGRLAPFGEKNIGMHKLGDTGEPVDIIALDRIGFLEPLRLLKIDVKYYEYEVLLGARNLLAEHNPVIYIELVAPEEESTPSGKAFTLLHEIGYEHTGNIFCASPVYEFVRL